MMTDAEITALRERTDAFIETLRAAIDEAAADLDPHSPCIDQARAGFKRIGDTLDAVPLVLFANLSNVDLAMKRRIGSGLSSIIATHLLAVGTGPTLDHADAAEFLSVFQPIIEMARKRRVN